MKCVIIGVGAAGIMAAKTIRSVDKGADIIMISTDEYVHSRCMLHKYLAKERDEAGMSFVDPDFFESNRIIWVKGKRITEIKTREHTVEMEDGLKIQYDKLLIATGADSFIPPVGDFRNAENVFGLRNLIDVQKMEKRMEQTEQVLIVGSGLVGLDAAYALLHRGKKVTVVEMADRILPLQLDETGAKIYQDLFEEAGCRFVLGRRASETTMDEDKRIRSVRLDDGTEIPCDLVIVAAGVRPAIGCAAGSGIRGERFIEVDDYMKTSEEDVYAAGDVTGRSGIWPNAQKQGQIAGYNMCGLPMQYVDTYAMKNTINFFGLVTLSLGRGVAEEGDEVVTCEDSKTYKRAILREGKLDSILLQGDMDYSGVYQYVIKNNIDISAKDVFKLSFADFYGIQEDGQYVYQM